MKKKILCVLRHVDERTFTEAHDCALQVFDEVIPVTATPFLKAVGETFHIGCRYPDYDLLVALDADTLLFETARKDIEDEWLRYLEESPNLFRLDMLVRDKFRGRVYAGCHAYLNSYSQQFSEHFAKLDYDPKQKRPESANVMALVKKLKLTSKNAKKIVGEHDFDQYYQHVYAKYYNRAVRDRSSFNKIYQMIEKKQQANPDDYDFVIALRAMENASKQGLCLMNTDASCYPNIQPLLEELGIQEKEPLDV